MPRNDIKYLALVDFTPGIHSRFGTPLSHRPGAVEGGVPQAFAQEDGTWQCYADPNGGLRPLPKRQNVISKSITDIGGGTTGYPDEEKFIGILDMAVMSPVIDNATYAPGDAPPDAVFLSFFYYRDPDGSTTYDRHSLIRQYKLYEGNTTSVYDAFTDSEEEEGSTDYLAYSNFFTSRASYGITGMDDPRQFNIGLPQLRGCLSVLPPDADVDGGVSDMHMMFAYPANVAGVDPASDSVSIPGANDTGNEIGWVWGHQGRTVVAFRRTGGGDPGTGGGQFLEPFGADGRMPIAEALGWSGVNFAFLNPANEDDFMWTEKTTFVEEAPSGYGAFATMNASELFLVKNRGGAVVVRGSLDNPTVIRLPGVESTKSLLNIPAVTPHGCFYGSTTGIWLWQGGDSSTCVSRNIDGDFWQAGPYKDQYRPGIKSRFAFAYPFVYFGNDWVMDIRSLETGGAPSWWRLVGREEGAGADADTFPYLFYDVSWNGRVYAAPGAISDDNTTVLDCFDDEVLATEYQWKSQPLMAAATRDIEFKDIILVAQGVGTVKITIEGLSGTTQTETFTINSSNRPVRLHLPTTTRCTEPIFTIRADGAVVETVKQTAPIVHGVYLGYTDMAGIPQ